MNAPARLAAFAAGLAVVFAGALGAGAAVGQESPAERAAAERGDDTSTGHGHDATDEEREGSNPSPAGVSLDAEGYWLDVEKTDFEAGTTSSLRFRVIAPSGEVLREFDEEQTKEMHLILVRRDLTGYQHLHPTVAADGTWETEVALPTPGVWRAYADFQPTAFGKPLTLGVDLFAPGDFQPEPLPAPATQATAEAAAASYTVTLHGHDDELAFTVERDGQPVTDLEPYLGALGHLVAIRAGDLAYTHVHPVAQADPGEIAFGVDYPGAGSYRLFLQFQHEGQVHTAAFTVARGRTS